MKWILILVTLSANGDNVLRLNSTPFDTIYECFVAQESFQEIFGDDNQFADQIQEADWKLYCMETKYDTEGTR